MTVLGRFSDKKPHEVVPCRIDFTKLLGVGETIVSATGLVKYVEGVEIDGGAAIMADGPVDTSASPVLMQRVKNGIAGNRYEVIIKATTSLGFVYEECGVLNVRAC